MVLKFRPVGFTSHGIARNNNTVLRFLPLTYAEHVGLVAAKPCLVIHAIKVERWKDSCSRFPSPPKYRVKYTIILYLRERMWSWKLERTRHITSSGESRPCRSKRSQDRPAKRWRDDIDTFWKGRFFSIRFVADGTF